MPSATFDLGRAHQGLDRILAWVTITVDGVRYPWAGTAIADPASYEDGYKAARLMLVEDLVLALSSRSGRLQASRCQFTISDLPDAHTGQTVVRRWLGQGKKLFGATVDIKFLTDADRRAGATPRVAFRGSVDDYEGNAGFEARFECLGIVGAELDQPVVSDTIGAHFASAPAATAALPIPIALGNLSDAGEASPRGRIALVSIGPLLDLFGTVWQCFAYAAHACDISTPPTFYVVDSSGAATEVDGGRYGVDVTAPGHTAYHTFWGPDAFYTDAHGHRWMIVGFIGPDGSALAAGTKTLRGNVLGAEPNGDGSGTAITSVYDQFALLLDNLTFLQETSSLGGNWSSTPPTFEDGTVKRDTGSWTLAKSNAGTMLPSGEAAARFISERITWGELIAEILRSGHALAGINAAGQFQLVVTNPAQTPARAVTEALEILKDSFSWRDSKKQGFANAQPYTYNPVYAAAGTAPTLTAAVPAEDLGSQTDYRKRQEAEVLDLTWRADSVTAAAVANLALRESIQVPRTVLLESGIHWATLQLGDIITVTHREGPMDGGWTDRALLILGQRIQLQTLQVQLTCLDYQAAASSSSPSPSTSPSPSPSASTSLSVSPSPSGSTSPSSSTSRSPSPSASLSPSSSVSPSPSPGSSASMSPSSSVSLSPSPSASVSPSSSTSRSPSPSASRSPSSSTSLSPSPSASTSPSHSESPSPSASESRSVSPSASVSPSGSESPSPSPSSSESPSPSASTSPSPSDDDPDGFDFDDVVHADPDTIYTQGPFFPENFDIPAAISIATDSSQAEFSINGGAWITEGTISPGQSVEVRMKSGGGDSFVTMTLTIGDTSGDWTIQVDIIE